MNKELINQLADYIEREAVADAEDLELGFNMSTYFDLLIDDFRGYRCNSVACVAGWAVMMSEEHDLGEPAQPILTLAKEFLGLTDEQAVRLFEPYVLMNWDDITPQQAAGVLRHFAETGDIAWSAFVPQEGIDPEDLPHE